MKNNVSLKRSKVKDNKRIENFLSENITEIDYSSGDENPPHHSEYVQTKDFIKH